MPPLSSRAHWACLLLVVGLIGFWYQEKFITGNAAGSDAGFSTKKRQEYRRSIEINISSTAVIADSPQCRLELFGNATTIIPSNSTSLVDQTHEAADVQATTTRRSSDVAGHMKQLRSVPKPNTGQRTLETAPRKPQRPMPARGRHTIWVPGFPGSGSEMLRDLVHELTVGNHVVGQDVYKGKRSCREEYVATCKTHHPFFGHNKPWQVSAERPTPFHSGFWLLLRNPLQALPSYGNYVYEHKAGKSDHSTKAPLNWWREWRDQHWKNHFERWVDLVRYWTVFNNVTNENSSHYQPQQHPQLALVVPYEQLVRPATGPPLAEAMAEELEAAGFGIKSGDLACRWSVVIQGVKAHKKRVAANYTPGYTLQQYAYINEGLSALVHELNTTTVTTNTATRAVRQQLVAVLHEYQQVVAKQQHVDHPFRPRQIQVLHQRRNQQPPHRSNNNLTRAKKGQ